MDRPLPEANHYTITLWDLPTWTEVDYVVDERLATDPSRNDQALLSCKLSEDAELWAVYLEKALAIHCGGWDAVTGGQVRIVVSCLCCRGVLYGVGFV